MLSAFGVEHFAKGVTACIKGSNCKHVANVVAHHPDGDWEGHAKVALAYGHSPDEIHAAIQHAHLSRTQGQLSDMLEQAKAQRRGVQMDAKRWAKRKKE